MGKEDDAIFLFKWDEARIGSFPGGGGMSAIGIGIIVDWEIAQPPKGLKVRLG